MTNMTEAMENIQSTVLMSVDDTPAKRQKTDQMVTSSDESTTTDKAVDVLLKPADNDAMVGALDTIEQCYNGLWREN